VASPPHRLIVNPYGVDLTYFPSREQAGRHFSASSTAARCRCERACATSYRRLPSSTCRTASYFLIGARHPHTEPFLARYASDKVRHVGPLPEFQLHEWYRLGSVFCMPSVEEGLAMVMIQGDGVRVAADCHGEHRRTGPSH